MSQNPYEPPSYQAAFSSLTHYQPLTTKLNLREYRRISKNVLELIIGVCFKFLRIRMPMSFAFADTSHFHRIAPEQLSPRARENIKPVADDALALNLKYAFSYWLPTVGTIEGAAATFLSEDGRSVLLIIYARTWTQVTVDEKTVFAFMSRLADGNALVTSGAKGDLDAPSHILGESYPGDSMNKVFERHLSRLSDAGGSVLGIRDADELEHVLREYENENFEFNVNRGVYVPISDGELARLQRLAITTPDLPKPKPKKQFQGIEMFCWIGLVVSLFLFSGNQPANGAQAIFRVGTLLAGLGGITIIWLIRGVLWMQSK